MRFRFLGYFLLLSLYFYGCAEKPVKEVDNRTRELPAGSKSSITLDSEKVIIDSSFNTKLDDIAPAIFIENVKDYDGYLDFCNPTMYSEEHTDDIRASRYLTMGDFRRNQDSLLFFSYLTKYIESISFTSPNEGYISLSHPPSSEFAERAGLIIEDVGGGTDIFKFTLNSNSRDFGYLKGSDGVNSEFWDSHPYASTQVIDNDTITLLLWSSDSKRGQAYTKAKYLDGKVMQLNDTDIYYIYLVNGNPTSRPKKIENNVSINSTNEGSPFIHCLCQETNWLFFSSDRKKADSVARVGYDIYATKIRTDFESLTLEVTEEPIKLDDKSENLGNNRTIPTSINSRKDERFPFVLNSENGTPVIYFSSDRLSSKVSVDSTRYIKSIGGYDIYKFDLDDRFVCREEPKPKGEYIVEVTVLETNPGNNKVDEAVVSIPGAESIDGRRFIVEQGECYNVTSTIEKSGYNILADGVIDYYYFKPKLSTDLSRPYQNKIVESIDSVKSPNAIKLDKLRETKDYDTIVRIEEVNGFPVKTVTYREEIYDNGIIVSLPGFKIGKNVRDSIVYYAQIIPDTTEDFVYRNEENLGDNELTSVNSTFDKLCVPDVDITTTTTIYDTIWVTRRSSKLPESRLEITLIDKCSRREVNLPIIKVSDSNGDVTVEKSKKLILPISPDMSYEIFGGSEQGNADCEIYSDMILHGYEAWNGECNNITELYISEASVPSIKGTINTSGFLRDTVIYDTVYLKSHTSPKPPCEIAFTTLKGINKNVPYFQTAFWEVNTSENLGDYETVGSHLYYLGGEGYNTDHPLAADSKFIELHPRSQYFPLWRGEETAERQKRIREYKRYAQVVDNNLSRIANTIAKERIPQFLRLQRITPESNHKLIIELEAVSDRRPVREGVYTGTETISYTQAEYDPQSGGISNEIVKIPSGALLGMDNDTLSKLRAWFGYKELYKRLENTEAFADLLDKGKVLLPDGTMTDREYQNKLAESDVIILTKGNFIDDDSRASIKNYDRDNPDQSFFVYDSTRKVNIVVRALVYENGRLIEPDCCNKDNQYMRELSLEEYEKLYMKEEEQD